MKSTKKIIIAAALSFIIILGGIPISVLASGFDYTIVDGSRMPIPTTYTFSYAINSIETMDQDEPVHLNQPEDLFIDAQGFLYIADTGNHRIVKLDNNGKAVDIFRGPNDKRLSSPRGVFVDNIGNMFIADTGNNRIVHLSSYGEYIEEFIMPESELLSDFFVFAPSKICITPTGNIYVLRGETIMILDAYNRFRGYMGQNQIGFNLLDTVLRIFASEEQKRVIRRRTAAAYISMTMDDKGMLYATSYDYAGGEIKKLNSVGRNIYRQYGVQQTPGFKLLSALTQVSLESESFRFGEDFDDDGNWIQPVFVDLAVDKRGIVTVVEEKTGKIYQYDQLGNLLTVFGGKGTQKGRFDFPSALKVDQDGRIFVLDRTRANIQIFKPTAFITRVHEATEQYSKGNYDEAYELWNEVLRNDENYRLARIGLANTMYKNEQWKDAMNQYLLADDRAGYSKAFIEYRYDMFRKNFPFVLLTILAFVAAIIFFVRWLRDISLKAMIDFEGRGHKKMGLLEGLKLAPGVIFRPVESFELIKNGRGRLNILSGLIILVLVLLTRVFYMFVVHYPLADIDLRSANLTLEAIKMLLPVATWVLASFAITSIMDGEAKADEILLASAYCMVPYILVTAPLAIVSRFMAREGITFYALAINGTNIWIFILIFTSLKVLNDYPVSKTALIYGVSGVTMILIWLVCLLGYVVTGRLYQFIEGIFQEVRML